MLEFLNHHKLAIINILLFNIWLYIYNKKKLRGLNKYGVLYFLSYLFIFILWDFFMIVSNNNPTIYLIFWTFIRIYEIYFAIYFINKLIELEFIPFIGLLLIVSVLPGPILSKIYLSYQPLIIFDFINSFTLVIIFMIVLYLLITKNFLSNYLETVLIITGMILFFSLSLITSNILSFGFLKYWSIIINSVIITQIFWVGSGIWILKVKS